MRTVDGGKVMIAAHKAALRQALLERGTVETPWSGAVRMLDGVDYHGTVWKVNGKLYVWYKNDPKLVEWNTADSKYQLVSANDY